MAKMNWTMVLGFGWVHGGDRCSPPVAVLTRWRRTEKGNGEREGGSEVPTRLSSVSTHARHGGAG
jgi:hypothetical protein